MSWSANVTCMPQDVKEKVKTLEINGVLEPSSQVVDQLAAAKVAVLTLFESGCVGTGEAFQITLSGHANPDHKPATGWANDMVTVAISQTNEAAVNQFVTNQEALKKNLE